jgi:hypothetical protein
MSLCHVVRSLACRVFRRRASSLSRSRVYTPCVRYFWVLCVVPMFLRHETHRHLARQVGDCGVFSRSASTWATIVSHVFTSVPTMRVIAKFVFKSSTPWKPLGKVVSRRAASSALGASQRSLSPFGIRLGRPVSGRMRRPL